MEYPEALLVMMRLEFTGDKSTGQPTKIEYEFEYNKDITLDSNIILKMPGWKTSRHVS